MSLPTIQQITNLYLYGTSTTPQNLFDDSLIREESLESIDIHVDINEYMDYIGQYVS